jgi:molybdopterin-guanine dinucleotide biosynthesis protein A
VVPSYTAIWRAPGEGFASDVKDFGIKHHQRKPVAYTSNVSFSSPALSDVTLAVLAGGEGSRMGMPKGSLRIGNQSILEYLIDRLSWPGPTAVITAPGREHPPGYQRFSHEYVDPTAGMGPLRGVLTALEHANTEWIVVLTVDMPGVRREQIAELLGSISADALGAMFARQSESGERIIEPFPLIIQTRAARILWQRLERGALSVVKLLEEPQFNLRQAPAEWKNDLWINLNRPEDMDVFRPQV